MQFTGSKIEKYLLYCSLHVKWNVLFWSDRFFTNIAKSQFLKIWFFDHFWANSNYGNAKNWEYGLWEFWLLFSKANKLKIDVDLQFICLRKQQSKFPLKMLTRRRLRMSQLAESDWNFKFVNKKLVVNKKVVKNSGETRKCREKSQK